MYKILYINGYRGHKSNKPTILKNELNKELNVEVYHIPTIYEGYFDGKSIDNFLKVNDINLIVASSMGGFVSKYFAKEYNIPLVSINPMIDYTKSTNTKNVTFDKKFDNISGFQHSILLNIDDELIPYKDTLELFKDKAEVEVFKRGGHRFNNIIEDGIPFIIKKIKGDLNYLG